MAKHSISEASRLTGKSRSTIHRHIKNGKISKEIGNDGSPVIDTSELQRAYGLKQSQDTSETPKKQQPDTPPETTALQVELDALKRENELLREDRDRWASQADNLTRLLTHQKPEPRSWLDRLLRRE